MSNVFVTISLVCLVSWLITAWVYRFSGTWNLLQPSNHRSSHLDPTPYCGGIGFVLTTTVLAFWLGWGEAPGVVAVFALAMTLAMLGLADDIWIVAVKFRLFAHILVVALSIYLVDPLPQILSQFGFVAEILPGSAAVALLALLVLLTGVWWVNLFNFMDGIDGLAAIQAISMLVGAASLLLVGNPQMSMNLVWLLMLAAAAATAGFLVLNWSPAKIFMGDVGSTWLAFVIFVLALLTIRNGWLSYATWLILAAVFVVDATVTLVTRMIRKERWLEAHRTHAYQIVSLFLWSDFESRGMAPSQARASAQKAVTLGVLALNVAWVSPLALLSVLRPGLGPLWLALAYLPLAIAVYRIRQRITLDTASADIESRFPAARDRRLEAPPLGFMMITRNRELARLADDRRIGRIFVDLEKLGKLERQGHLDTHISDHSVEDVAAIRAVIRHAELLVRVNPLNPSTREEVESAIAGGADILMLPMYRSAEDVREFLALVGGRVKVMPLLETGDAANCLDEVVRMPGVSEIYIGLNDLHLDLNHSFLFEPLANGMVDRLVEIIRDAGLPFGFGGVARVDEGIIPGNLVLAEHLRLGSSWVILSRTFQRNLGNQPFEQAAVVFNSEIGRLEETIAQLRLRGTAQIEADRRMLCSLVEQYLRDQASENRPAPGEGVGRG